VLCFVLTCFVGLIELEKVSGSNEFHMIAQIDDSTQVVIEHIHMHDEHGHAWKAILNWSNNIQDKWHALSQIVLGSLDPMCFVLCSLALWV
jgi:hypothetical protein